MCCLSSSVISSTLLIMVLDHHPAAQSVLRPVLRWFLDQAAVALGSG
jgi:hypothetical protein